MLTMFVNSPVGARNKGEPRKARTVSESSGKSRWSRAMKHGRKTDGVAIQTPPNKDDKDGSAIGALSTSPNGTNAQTYLDHLAANVAQGIRGSCEFVPVRAEEPNLIQILEYTSSALLRIRPGHQLVPGQFHS